MSVDAESTEADRAGRIVGSAAAPKTPGWTGASSAPPHWRSGAPTTAALGAQFDGRTANCRRQDAERGREAEASVREFVRPTAPVTVGEVPVRRTSSVPGRQAARWAGPQHVRWAMHSPLLAPAEGEATRNQLNAINGCYVPCLLNILGAILYLRIGFSVGMMGMMGTLGIFFVSQGIAYITIGSFSAIVTNGKMKGGGAYVTVESTLVWLGRSPSPRPNIILPIPTAREIIRPAKRMTLTFAKEPAPMYAIMKSRNSDKDEQTSPHALQVQKRSSSMSEDEEPAEYRAWGVLMSGLQ